MWYKKKRMHLMFIWRLLLMLFFTRNTKNWLSKFSYLERTFFSITIALNKKKCAFSTIYRRSLWMFLELACINSISLNNSSPWQTLRQPILVKSIRHPVERISARIFPFSSKVHQIMVFLFKFDDCVNTKKNALNWSNNFINFRHAHRYWATIHTIIWIRI